MKILYLTNIPSPYRVNFFNELGKHCDLTVLFEKSASGERDESWKNYKFDNFNGVILNGISVSVDMAFTLKPISFIKDNKFDAVICGGIASPTAIAVILYMQKHHIAYYIEADGATAKSGKGFKERLKKKLISGAKGYFSSSASCDNYFITYGAKKDKIFRYPFTSLFDRDISERTVGDEQKLALRSELGLSEEKIVVSVGRFSYMNGYGKGYDALLKAAEKLPKNIGIYIIGDEPTAEFVDWKKNKNLEQVHFLPFKQKDELFKYYKAADLSVLLSRGEAWGLFVNESMANGTPVVTTDVCVAGTELIENGENGFIVSVDAVDEVVKIISRVCSDDALRDVLSQNAIKTIKNYTIEKMAESHINALL